ncbi:MAG: DNA mismatch repair endonuclease MutL [Bacteroidia bacterium]|nr:DNA mismatch repair endonuclease MutL [Bacteroidia bacterium]
MKDIIRLLPESVANQIAAGEVVQRPASAVKELLENAVDAGATEIKLIIKDAGRTLIQVVDNGCGMSERDARMCFERHATSKIKSTNDLLAIRTLGFRGEALASIASIAQVELKSKRTEEEIGTSIQVYGSEFISQTAVSCSDGTSVIIKNLFYNVPARRNFLKSNTLELKYIMEEFNRVALVHPDISFHMYNQDKILIQLSPSNLKQRLLALLGSHNNHKLIPIRQETPMVNLSGFIGKPEFAKKKRGEQYFFANGRFIKNPYLNHAVENAFQELIPKDSYPTYFIYLEVDPPTIDVNIHPTKTEINFQDAKSIYAILNAAIKQSIGKYNLTPALDFETEKSMDLPPLPDDHPIRPPSITINPDYNPFEKQTKPQLEFNYKTSAGERGAQWQKPDETAIPILQIENRYIVTHLRNGIVVIDQQAAHERILYEEFLLHEKKRDSGAQKLLLPQTVQVSHDDAEMVRNISDLLLQAGFEISGFGKNTFVVHTAPVGVESSEIQPLIEVILESYKSETDGFRNKEEHKLARTMACRLAIKHGKQLNQQEVSSLIQQLMSCATPDLTPDGKPTMILLSFEDLVKKFKHTN